MYLLNTHLAIYMYILAVQFGHARSINTHPRVNSRREEEEYVNFSISAQVSSRDPHISPRHSRELLWVEGW
jgi:hypothetical protein